MSKIEYELRSLIDVYTKRQVKLIKEEKEAVEYDDRDALIANEALQRLCRIMIAELFQTMKAVGILDEEEIKYGGIKIWNKS